MTKSVFVKSSVMLDASRTVLHTMQMTINELQHIVWLEGIILGLIVIIIIAAIKRWKTTVYISSGVAAAASFAAWSFVLALGSLFVYVPASILLWHELERQPNMQGSRNGRIFRVFAWILLGVGVFMLIGKNIYNILICLN